MSAAVEVSEAADDFQCLKQNIFTLYKVAQLSEKRRQLQWKDDKSVLEEYISALTKTREVMRGEEKRMAEDLAAASNTSPGPHSTPPGSPKRAAESREHGDPTQGELGRLKERLVNIEREVDEVRNQLNGGFKGVEMEIWETKLTVLQDTKRMCSDEIKQIEESKARAARAENKRKRREKGRAELTSLRDQVARVEVKLDAAKRAYYFPSADGYKFRAGGSGVFVGAKDLHISDVSGSFLLAASGTQSKPKQESSGKLKLHVGGISPRPDEPNGAGVSLRTPTISSKHQAVIMNPKQLQETVSETIELPSASDSIPVPSATVKVEATRPQPPMESVEEPTSYDRPLSWVPGLSQMDATASRAKCVAVKLLNRRVSRDRMKWVPNKDKPRTEKLVQGSENRTGLVKRMIQGKRKGRENLKSQFTSRLKSQFADPGMPTLLTRAFNENMAADRKERNQSSTGCSHPSENPCGEAGCSQKHDTKGEDNTEKHWLDQLVSNPNTSEQQSNYTNERGDFSNGGTNLDTGNNPTLENLSIFEDEMENGDLGVKAIRTEHDGATEAGESSSRLNSDRKGVYVKVKADDLQLVGEKGTRVPNVIVKEILLEVECVLSVDVEYTAAGGWQIQGGIKFEILKLKKKVVGNSLPLPLTLVKTVLNMVLPKLVERLLASNLPIEFGEYILDSGSDCMLNGEITIVGPPLTAMQASLCSRSPSTSGSSRARAENLKASVAGKEARALLGLTNTDAGLLEEAFEGRESTRLVEAPVRCTIYALCEFQRKFGKSETWNSLCNLWNKALKILALLKGWNSTLDFVLLMDGIVADLAAKPMRGNLLVTRLNCNLNVDAMVVALRDYMERSARELDSSPPDVMSGPQVPLEEQLEALDLWHRQWIAKLNLFESKFKSATCALVMNADSQGFDIGLDRLHYEGPLSVKLPVGSHEDGMLAYEISMPVTKSKTQASSAFDAFKQAMISLKQHARREYESKMSPDEEIKSSPDSDDKKKYPVGRLFAHRLTLGMSVDERELARILLGDDTDLSSSTPILSPIGLQQMLGCLGDMLSCTVGPSDSKFSEKPYLMSLATSDLAKFKADVDTVGFQSLVSPADLIRMIHVFMMEAMQGLRNKNRDKHLTFVDSTFKQVLRYVNKRALDVGICAKVQAIIQREQLFLSLQEMSDVEGGTCAPLHVVNDVDLMAVIETLNFGSQKIASNQRSSIM